MDDRNGRLLGTQGKGKSIPEKSADLPGRLDENTAKLWALRSRALILVDEGLSIAEQHQG